MASLQRFINPSGDVAYRVQWRVRKDTGWSSRQETFNDKTKAERFKGQVENWGGARAREELHLNEGASVTVPTFEEYARRYLALSSGQLTGIEPQTRADYLRICEISLFPVLGNHPINGIDETDVGAWIAWQEAQPSQRRPGQLIAAKTVKNRHGILSEILKAAGKKYDTGNPARGAKLRKGSREEPVFLTLEEFRAILDASPARWRPLYSFLVGSQLRLSEARALVWSDLNRGNPPTVRVSKAWKANPDGAETLGPPKSDKARRTVSLWPALVTELGTPGKGLIFPHPETAGVIPRNTIGKAWRRAVVKSGVERSPRLHDLRHTGASWLIAEGVPLPYIQARLGHEKITTTVDTYGHLVPEAHLIMADVLAAKFAPQNEIEQ